LLAQLREQFPDGPGIGLQVGDRAGGTQPGFAPARDPHDAEDCSQATFVVLARKGRSLSRSERIESWLYGVARHISLRAARNRGVRARREEAAAMIRRTAAGQSAASTDAGLRDLVYRELESLTAAQRQAVILRYLEGRSEREAAEIAGCPQGTLACRASRGLARLRARLAKRGRALAVAPLVGFLETGAQAAVPAGLLPSILSTSKLAATGAAAGATGSAVLAMAEGVLKMMFWAKVKTTAAATLAALAGVAVLGLGLPKAWRAVTAQEAAAPARPIAPAPTGPRVKDEVLRFSRPGFARLAPFEPGIWKSGFYVFRSGEELAGAPFALVSRNRVISDRDPRAKAAAGWPARAGIDFQKSMCIVAAAQESGDRSELKITGIAVRSGELLVEFTVRRGGRYRKPRVISDMVTCPRRDLPVVFRRDGRQVARVLYGKAATSGFSKPVGGLSVSLRVAPVRWRVGEFGHVAMEVAVKNSGKSSLMVCDDLALSTRIDIRDSHGRTWSCVQPEPAPPPRYLQVAQWHDLWLKPSEEGRWTVPAQKRSFVPVNISGRATRKLTELPAGTYAISCTLADRTARVRARGRDPFASARASGSQCWQGRVSTEPVKVTVLPPARKGRR
jgi:RNA polymerase sigma factor (sigma-70 family)